jgi:hypothetical protein
MRSITVTWETFTSRTGSPEARHGCQTEPHVGRFARPRRVRPVPILSEPEFDAIFARIEKRQLDFWADPHKHKPHEINHWDDGRGVYFEDLNGHLLEVITRSYGTAGVQTKNPHPLVAEKLEKKDSPSA